MDMEELVDEYIETDILIIGGGLAGTMAAIRAREKGDVDVTVVEKANMSRSGDPGKGLDHYPAVAHPKINGLTPEEYGRYRADEITGLVRSDLSVTTAKYAIKPIAVLEQIGVRMHEDDGTYWMGPGRMASSSSRIAYSKEEKRYQVKVGDFLLYRGGDLKPKLASMTFILT
jgi:succinate dehydrogenase/fumarate reductase flavoprotein subunit